MEGLKLTSDERGVEGLFHYPSCTLADFMEANGSIEPEPGKGQSALAHRRSQWPDLVLGIPCEVENAYAGEETFTDLGSV